VMDDPTAKVVALPSPAGRRAAREARQSDKVSKVHKPALDEMGIALYHEVAPHRPGADKRNAPRKPTLDEMGPGVESIPGKRESSSPRSTLGRPGMHGGFKPRRR